MALRCRLSSIRLGIGQLSHRVLFVVCGRRVIGIFIRYPLFFSLKLSVQLALRVRTEDVKTAAGVDEVGHGMPSCYELHAH